MANENILRSGIWMMMEKILRIVNGIFVSAGVARHLGPHDYGLITIYLAVPGVFSAFAGMGANYINLTEMRKGTGGGWPFFYAALWARMLVTIACLIAFFLLAANIYSSQIYPLFLLIPLTSLSIIGDKLLAEGRFSIYAMANSVGLVVGSIVKLCGIALDWGIVFFIYASLVEYCISTALHSIAVFQERCGKNSFRLIRKNEIFHYIKLCLPTAIAASAVYIYLRIELFLVNTWIGGEATGLWSIVMMSIQPWSMVAAAVLPIVNNRLLRKATGGAEYDSAMVSLTRKMAALGVVASILNFAFSKFVLVLILGEKYKPAVDLIAIASLTIIPLFISGVQDLFISHRRATNIVLKKLILAIPISISLLYVFGSEYGLKGAACAMVMSYFVSMVIGNAVLDRDFFNLIARSLSLNGIRNREKT